MKFGRTFGRVWPVLVVALLVIALAGCKAATTKSKAITGPSDLKGKIVGVQVDTTGQLQAEKILGKGYKNLKKYDDTLTAFADLKAGRLDAIVNDLPVSVYIIKKTYPNDMKIAATIVTNEGYGIWVKKGNTQLRDALNWALDAIKKDGTYATIYKKWFGKEPSAEDLKPSGAPADRPKPTIKPLVTGTLSFGADTSFPPFEFKEGADYVGFDVDLGKEVCKRLGVKYKIVSTAWDGIIANLKSDKYDAIMSSMTVYPDRQKEMDATQIYIMSNQSIAVKK